MDLILPGVLVLVLVINEVRYTRSEKRMLETIQHLSRINKAKDVQEATVLEEVASPSELSFTRRNLLDEDGQAAFFNRPEEAQLDPHDRSRRV